MTQGQIAIDAEALFEDLKKGIQPWVSANTHVVGVTSGGAWMAERLGRELQIQNAVGAISSAMHRDDFDQRGLSNGGQTHLPFEVEGADIVLLDDVLYTGRTIRAVINELFDYGRPMRIRLAVLVDRGGRELPLQADFAAARFALDRSQSLALALKENGQFVFSLESRDAI
jgi:pyrimidine operon attenuation protein/uracil phosphoribosyltransferase